MTTPAECRPVRDRLLERMLAGNGTELPPGAEAEHLGTCPGCRRYLEGLGMARHPASGAPLYTPGLRRRTLAAVADSRRRAPAWLAPLLVPASAASVALSIVAPVWLLDHLLRPWFASSWPSLGLALLICGSAALVTWGSALALWKVRFGSGAALRAAVGPFREVPRV